MNPINVQGSVEVHFGNNRGVTQVPRETSRLYLTPLWGRGREAGSGAWGSQVPLETSTEHKSIELLKLELFLLRL